MVVNCTDQNSVDESIVNIIPKPLDVKTNKCAFSIKPDTKILVQSEAQEALVIAEYLANKFNAASEYNLTVEKYEAEENNEGAILFTTHNANKELGDEGYELEVNNNFVVIKAPKPAGLFYGVQSLLQLLPIEIVSGDNSNKNVEWSLPAVSIKDKPHYGWRGMLLDPARHFHSIEYLKKFIDLMAGYKLNTLHMHLGDDQGWRVEIKKYPKLVKVGSKRYDLPWNGWQGMSTKGVPLIGGYYTQEDIKELVAYAQSRNITIVPEIEMPGHTLAALASYPEYSCTGGPFTVASGGVDIQTNHTYCIGNEKTYGFLQDVLTEVMDIFPSKYIHIGGDETTRMRWEKCSKCQARIKNQKLDGLDGLYGYFLGRMGKFIESKGRKMIGWDEILEGGESVNGTIMAWRGMDRSLKAIGLGFDVIQTNSSHLYFDDQKINDEGEPRLPLELTYSFEPIPEGVSKEESKHILGVQACIWEIPSREPLEHAALPRMAALAEIAWTKKENKNLESFVSRLAYHYPRYEAMGVIYRQPDLLGGFNGLHVFTDIIEVNILKPKLNSEVHYTLDGSEPTHESTLYTGPFYLENSAVLKACEFYSDGSKGRMRSGTYDKQELLSPVELNNLQPGLNYQYVEGKYDHTDQVPRDQYKNKGVLNSFVFPQNHNKHYFGVVYSGIIQVSDDDIYTFCTETNDGSQLYIGDKLVVNHGGLHPAEEKCGSIALQAGYHPIKVIYFQNAGASSIKVSYKGPKIEKQEIPKSILFHKK